MSASLVLSVVLLMSITVSSETAQFQLKHLGRKQLQSSETFASKSLVQCSSLCLRRSQCSWFQFNRDNDARNPIGTCQILDDGQMDEAELTADDKWNIYSRTIPRDEVIETTTEIPTTTTEPTTLEETTTAIPTTTTEPTTLGTTEPPLDNKLICGDVTMNCSTEASNELVCYMNNNGHINRIIFTSKPMNYDACVNRCNKTSMASMVKPLPVSAVCKALKNYMDSSKSYAFYLGIQWVVGGSGWVDAQNQIIQKPPTFFTDYKNRYGKPTQNLCGVVKSPKGEPIVPVYNVVTCDSKSDGDMDICALCLTTL